MNQLPEEDRSYVRFQAYYIANHTFWNLTDEEGQPVFYDNHIIENPSLLVQLFTILLKHSKDDDPTEAAKIWLKSVVESDDIGDMNWDKNQVANLLPWQQVIIEFTEKICALHSDPMLPDAPAVLQQFFNIGGSGLEFVYAVLTNVMEISPSDGTVLNKDDAIERAMDAVRLYILDDYQPEREFEEWETELV